MIEKDQNMKGDGLEYPAFEKSFPGLFIPFTNILVIRHYLLLSVLQR